MPQRTLTRGLSAGRRLLQKVRAFLNDVQSILSTSAIFSSLFQTTASQAWRQVIALWPQEGGGGVVWGPP